MPSTSGAGEPGQGMVVRRSASVLWRRAADEVLVLRPGEREIVTLAGTGPLLWDALAVPQTVDELAAEVALHFGEPVQVVRGDLGRAVDDLIERGVMETA